MSASYNWSDVNPSIVLWNSSSDIFEKSYSTSSVFTFFFCSMVASVDDSVDDSVVVPSSLLSVVAVVFFFALSTLIRLSAFSSAPSISTSWVTVTVMFLSACVFIGSFGS